jgi:hypothetical protein
MAWVDPATVATGDVLTASKWNQDVVENTNQLYASRRLATSTQGSNQTLNQTVVGSASDIFPSDLTFTADGTSAYRVEFFAASVECASGGFTQIILVDGGGTSITQLAQVHSTSGVNRSPVMAVFYYTPSAGSVSVNVRGIYATAGNGVVYSVGSGFAPIRMSVFGPDIT